jgi:tRNA modification GTPase
MIRHNRAIAVWNKSDLVGTPPESVNKEILQAIPREDFLAVSAKTGSNILILKQRITAKIHLSEDRTGKQLLLSVRQKNLLPVAQMEVNKAIAFFRDRSADELAAAHLRSAHKILGEILGDHAPAEVLDHIFSTFCIGK